jgi:glycosyltransferase involved in cell wall biosynthesis
VLSLYASCDAFVSLHRAEGLGLILMEMMALGKPVITTAWSGNMDFTTAENSCLVGFDMIEVSASHLAYRNESGSNVAVRWADPSLPEAAGWMRKLADDAELRATMGAQASADMASRLAEHNSPAIVEELRRLYEAFDHGAAPHAPKAEAIRAWRKSQSVRRFARLPRAAVLIAARRLGLYKG